MPSCEHDFEVDLDGHISCSKCHLQNNEKPEWKDPLEGLTNQVDFE